jgi:hypothetical protein
VQLTHVVPCGPQLLLRTPKSGMHGVPEQLQLPFTSTQPPHVPLLSHFPLVQVVACAHSWQLPPSAPQSATEVPAWQLLLMSQQPGQVVAQFPESAGPVPKQTPA